MKQEDADKIFKLLESSDCIDLESIAYDDNNSYLLDIAKDLFNYIEAYANKLGIKRALVNNEHQFPEYHLSFTYKNKKYLWRLLIGQGSSCQIWNECDNPIFDLQFENEELNKIKNAAKKLYAVTCYGSYSNSINRTIYVIADDTNDASIKALNKLKDLKYDKINKYVGNIKLLADEFDDSNELLVY